MVRRYYAGHQLEWMETFQNTIPENKHYVKCIAHCVAEVILHQYKYTKNSNIVLNHNILESFGLNRKTIKNYLLFFQKAGLIKLKLKKGASPRIELLHLPKAA